MSELDVGQYGVWLGAGAWTPALARRAEELGYGALWIGSSPDGDLHDAEALLAATQEVVVGTSIVNVWKDDAEPVAAAYHRLDAAHPGRLLLGIGIGHPEADREYASPYDSLVGYLDALDVAGVPKQGRALAALGPRVLRLSGDRSAGAIPYLTTPEHTARARADLGAGPLLAPEHKVALGEPARTRSLADRIVQRYLQLSNYTRNLRNLGFSEADLADGGSDALVDALVLQGSAGSVAERLAHHLDAGADHVAVQPLTADGADPTDDLTRLADALGL